MCSCRVTWACVSRAGQTRGRRLVVPPSPRSKPLTPEWRKRLVAGGGRAGVRRKKNSYQSGLTAELSCGSCFWRYPPRFSTDETCRAGGAPLATLAAKRRPNSAAPRRGGRQARTPCPVLPLCGTRVTVLGRPGSRQHEARLDAATPSSRAPSPPTNVHSATLSVCALRYRPPPLRRQRGQRLC